MTDLERGGVPMEPPWSVDVLADLHAGVLEQSVSDRLWPRVRDDPDARAVLDALDTTRTELARLPPLTMPPQVAARIDAALAAEIQAAAPVAPVVDLAQARRRRNRRLGWGAGMLVAAAAVVAVLAVVLPRNATPGNGVAAPATANPGASSGSAPLALTSAQLASAGPAAIGRSDYGPLAEPGKLAACLSANGLNPNQPPVGAMRVTLDGRPGVLLVLTTGQLAQYRLLVVGPTCAANDPARLNETVIGGISHLPTAPTR